MTAVPHRSAAANAGAPSHPERARWYNSRGLRFLNDGNTLKARELFRKAIVHDVLFDEPYRHLMTSSSEARNAHRFSVVVATWNRLGDLRRCIDSLRHNSYYANEIIVVDNASTDGTVEYLRGQHDVRAILSSEHISVTHAYNLGFAASTGDLLGPLNDDNEVMPGWDLALAETMATDGRAGVGASLIIYGDGRVQTPGHHNDYASLAHPWIGNVPHVDTSAVINRNLADYPRFHEPRECDYALFPFMTRDCYERIGGFDELFTHHFADPDLGYRVQQAGYRNLYCPTSVIVHHDLSSRDVARRTPKFEEGLDKFARKWQLKLKDQNAEPDRTYAYLDAYWQCYTAANGESDGGWDESRIADLISWIPDGTPDALDVGPASARVVSALRDRSIDARALTSSRAHAPDVPHVVGDMSFLPFGFTACRLIVARHALSRSVWPLLTLTEFNRVLDDDGYVLLTVPPYDDVWLRSADHRSVLTEAQWRRLFADAGFCVERASTPESDPMCEEQRYLLRKQRSVLRPVRPQ
jgi:GT2 family glycosyltransferase